MNNTHAFTYHNFEEYHYLLNPDGGSFALSSSIGNIISESESEIGNK